MSLSYGLALSDGLFFVVWVWCALENEMVSVERIQQYSDLPSESPLTLPDKPLPSDWPSAGHIIFDKVEVCLVVQLFWVCPVARLKDAIL